MFKRNPNRFSGEKRTSQEIAQLMRDINAIETGLSSATAVGDLRFVDRFIQNNGTRKYLGCRANEAAGVVACIYRTLDGFDFYGLETNLKVYAWQALDSGVLQQLKYYCISENYVCGMIQVDDTPYTIKIVTWTHLGSQINRFTVPLLPIAGYLHDYIKMCSTDTTVYLAFSDNASPSTIYVRSYSFSGVLQQQFSYTCASDGSPTIVDGVAVDSDTSRVFVDTQGYYAGVYKTLLCWSLSSGLLLSDTLTSDLGNGAGVTLPNSICIGENASVYTTRPGLTSLPMSLLIVQYDYLGTELNRWEAEYNLADYYVTLYYEIFVNITYVSPGKLRSTETAKEVSSIDHIWRMFSLIEGAQEASSTSWNYYLTDQTKRAIPSPVPLNFLGDALPKSDLSDNVAIEKLSLRYIADMRTALETLVSYGYIKNPKTGNVFNWDVNSSDNLYYATMNSLLPNYGVTDGVSRYDWVEKDLAYKETKDLHIGEIYHIVRELERALHLQGIDV